MEIKVNENDVRIDKYLASPPEKVAIKVYREYEKILKRYPYLLYKKSA